jgi:cobalamin-dependent methionine synthase I
MKIPNLSKPFCVIGENIHTTRAVLREGKLVVRCANGDEAVRYTTTAGEVRHLKIPEAFKEREDFQEGRVKHVMVAVQSAMAGEEPEASEGLNYLRILAEKQVKGGADYLDLNVDEISWRMEDQMAAMRWLVGAIEPLSPVPLSIDSSKLDILLAGIEACECRAGKPMLNSASLERIEALDVAARYELPVIVTAAGESGMPSNADERIANASRMIDAGLAKGIPLDRMYVDTLVFPVSVDPTFVEHCLGAFRELREKYGESIHLTGGLSNVSFGMPCRKLINEAFINLSVDAGADSGIVDPVANQLLRVFQTDRQSRAYQLAEEMLLGRDPGCFNFLEAYRDGELEPVAR